MNRNLKQWLRALFVGTYEAQFAELNRQIGIEWMQIGLEPPITHAVMTRFRHGLLIGLPEIWPGDATDLMDYFPSLNRLLDMTWAIIEQAHHGASSSPRH